MSKTHSQLVTFRQPRCLCPAQRLTALGVNLYFKSVVGDNPGRMKEIIARALERDESTTKFDEIPVQAIDLMTR